MNLALSIALCASLCTAEGLHPGFPGSARIWSRIVEHTDAALLAEATLRAATSPAASNQAYTVTNSDTWRWSELWPLIACWFELRYALPVSHSFQQLVTGYRIARRSMAEQHKLREADILRLNDGLFADFVFSWNDIFGDGSKLRRAGFTRYFATGEMFCSLFSQLRASRIIL